MHTNTAKHFALQLGSLISLYLSVSFLLVLLFGIINIRFPDEAFDYYSFESAANSIRIGIAMVVVFVPTYLILTRLVNRMRRAEPGGAYLNLTKWLIYLSLLIGGGALLGDLVAVIMAFLEGELTQRFLLKAFAVLVVVGAAFHYYVLDAKGVWLKNESKSMFFGIGAAVVTLAAVGYGFAQIDPPTVVREQKLDAQQITDLEQIQWRIQSYYDLNSRLPGSLSELPGEIVPEAPTGREPYSYRLTENGYELCAVFAAPSSNDQFAYAFDWSHKEGRACFERNPEGMSGPKI
ncbi:hypothetical protein K2Q16_01630 [Patescibacteria group bacterium]|nr:hypothetical protein [Patescibacteria group bacterium]